MQFPGADVTHLQSPGADGKKTYNNELVSLKVTLDKLLVLVRPLYAAAVVTFMSGRLITDSGGCLCAALIAVWLDTYQINRDCVRFHRSVENEV